MQQEIKYIIPKDRVEFIRAEVVALKADNRSDHESGDFDAFNHKQEGAYKAYERVLGWITEHPAGGNVWVKARITLPRIKPLPYLVIVRWFEGEHLRVATMTPNQLDDNIKDRIEKDYEWLCESNEQPVEQKENEAVAFAEHCKMLPFGFIRGIGWHDRVTGTEWTTERLYNEWKQSNK